MILICVKICSFSHNCIENLKEKKDSLSIKSFREGEVPGTHNIIYKSTVDNITIEHKAKNRKGFALGAVIAAEWIVGKKGVFKIDDVLNL